MLLSLWCKLWTCLSSGDLTLSLKLTLANGSRGAGVNGKLRVRCGVFSWTHHLSHLQHSRDGPGVAHVEDAVPGRPGGRGRGRDDGVRHVDGKRRQENSTSTNMLERPECRRESPSTGNLSARPSDSSTRVKTPRVNTDTSAYAFHNKSPRWGSRWTLTV